MMVEKQQPLTFLKYLFLLMTVIQVSNEGGNTKRTFSVLFFGELQYVFIKTVDNTVFHQHDQN